MTDLLVSSLMVDGGLQLALTAAIKVEVQDLEDTCFEKESEQVQLSFDTHLIEIFLLGYFLSYNFLKICEFYNLKTHNLLIEENLWGVIQLVWIQLQKKQYFKEKSSTLKKKKQYVPCSKK